MSFHVEEGSRQIAARGQGPGVKGQCRVLVLVIKRFLSAVFWEEVQEVRCFVLHVQREK